MAAPDYKTTLDISGHYLMNKALSDPSFDEILRLQGVGLPKREIFNNGTITLYVNHFKDGDNDNVEHLDVTTRCGGFEGRTELGELTWKENTIDAIAGSVICKSRRVKIDEIENQWLKEGWTKDTLDNDAIESYVKSDTAKGDVKWVARQVWGVAEVNGERRYIRRVYFVGPGGEEIKACLTYDYIAEHPGPASA